MEDHQAGSLNQIAIVGGYVPRQCGIATFTADLRQSLAEAYPEVNVFAVPTNDIETGYQYPTEVRFELAQNDLATYRLAADYLNMSAVDVVSLQHEYGIFGGPAGSYVLTLMRELRMPIVTTLHTVLKNPEKRYRIVLEEAAHLSDRVIVMSEKAQDFLSTIYRIPLDKVDVVPHGIPDVPFIDPGYYKDQFGVEGKVVLLTFGLLAPNKGVENAIRALPKILERHPDVVYIILGATHPHVRMQHGESYRLSLEQLAETLGVASNVIFHNRFVTKQEMVEFMGVADVYVTPYLNEEQITSGTLSQAVGAGKAVISTPYWHAQELLADGRGVLVPFRDPDAIAEATVRLLDDPTERDAVRKRAYMYGRQMIWSTVAKEYMRIFSRATEERKQALRRPHTAKTLAQHRAVLPPLNLEHLRRMTDPTGMLQHAVYAVPNYQEGYTTDDNARALAVASQLEQLGPASSQEARALASRYLAFLWYAFDREKRRFRNFLSYSREWLESVGSEDSHGRALWGLGSVVGLSGYEGLWRPAGVLFTQAVTSALEFNSPRAWAFTLIGVHEYMRRFYGDRESQMVREELANRLLALYRQHASDDWPWFEDSLAYANAKLPHALLLAGQWLPNSEMAEVGLRSLNWLLSVQRSEEGFFSPVGSNGFFQRHGDRAVFDQQPIEAQTTVSACLEAYRMTGDERWYREAHHAFQWFLGRNHLGSMVYDASTGGCRDGVMPNQVNENQGAESTLAFLLSLLELRLFEDTLSPADERALHHEIERREHAVPE